MKAVFDPASDGKLTGNKVGVVSIGEKLAYALRDDLTWGEVKNELPTGATYKDATKKFTGWNPVLQNDSEKVKAATYVAQYESETDVIDVTNPSTPTPAGYAKVTFDKGEHGVAMIGTEVFFVKKNTQVNLSTKTPTVKADRKSTRLNSSHVVISYAVFCLKKKNMIPIKSLSICFRVI